MQGYAAGELEMSTLDDVHADVASHAPLTHAQMTQIVDLLDRSAAHHHRIAVIVTLRSLLPCAGQRLAAASAAQAAEYLGVLKSVMIEALTGQSPVV